MKWEEEACKGCGKSHLIANRTYWLCSNCVYKRNHKGKSREEVYKEKKKFYVKKSTGEKDFFLKIWEERFHYCEKCGKYLGEQPKAFFFSHIKSKGAYPELRFDKNNIELLCQECHYKYEFGDRNS